MNKFLIFCLLVGVTACQQTLNHQNTQSNITFETIEFSKMFGVALSGNEKRLFTIHQTDTQWYETLKTQNPRIVVLSSVFASYFSELNCQENIIGVDNMHYYNDSILLNRFQKGWIKEYGNDGQIDEEAILRLKPDVVVGSSFNKSNPAFVKRLKSQGITLIICDNFKEQDPLARAEWIKFFGAMVNQFERADSFFQTIKYNYQLIAKATKQKHKKPLVMTDAKFGETWHTPGGASYTAQLINDAGGTYVFNHKKDKFSYPLSFEELVKSAGESDVWIHVNQFHSLQELTKADPRYEVFKPFRNQQVFNYNKRENQFGGNDFWEKGVVRPDIILKDLQVIFSGDENAYNNMYFYTKLK